MDGHERLQDPMLCQLDWTDLITAAETAGGRAARRLAQQCSSQQLGPTGRVWIRIEPVTVPVASWLYRRGTAVLTDDHHGVYLPVILTASTLAPAVDAASKANSLLTAHAYAAAYSTVLADEAGVVAWPLLAGPPRLPSTISVRVPPSQPRSNSSPEPHRPVPRPTSALLPQ